MCGTFCAFAYRTSTALIAAMALAQRHRDIAECCLEFLNIELVKTFMALPKMRPELAARRVEAIGFQVGQQLVER